MKYNTDFTSVYRIPYYLATKNFWISIKNPIELVHCQKSMPWQFLTSGFLSHVKEKVFLKQDILKQDKET